VAGLWTPELDVRLTCMREQGLSISECVARLGKELGASLTRNQVQGRIERLKTARRKGRVLGSKENVLVREQRVRRPAVPDDRPRFTPARCPTLTGRLMGDPPPGRTPWATGA
jgi:hypothetical protein